VNTSFNFNKRTALRWLFGLIFLWSGLSKVANLQEFYGSLLTYGLPLPEMFLKVTVVVLPWLELLCGLGLITGIWTEAVLAWTMGLFLLFAMVTGQAWARGLEISCGCFDLRLLGLSPARTEALTRFAQSAGFAFVRSLLFTAGGLYLLRRPLPKSAPNTSLGKSRTRAPEIFKKTVTNMAR
jgi:putative oxidoreductase